MIFAATTFKEDLYFWLGLIAVVLIIFGLQAYFGKKRAQALATAALEMGFNYQPKGTAPTLAIHLFTQGRSQEARNVLTGSAGGFEAMVFDFKYVTGHGRNQRENVQTVAAFRCSGARLPDFQLGPESIFHKIGARFGYQDIDFDSSPGFSQRFLLRGADEAAIRSFFAPAILGFFETLPEHRKWHVEGADDWLAIYQANHKVKPADLRTFLDEASPIASTLFSQAKSRSMFA